jgi:hypothetical protein
MLAFIGCLPQAQAAMGTMGLPVLVAVLQEDREDLDLLRGALEALLASFGAGGTEDAAGARKLGQHAQEVGPWRAGGLLLACG